MSLVKHVRHVLVDAPVLKTMHVVWGLFCHRDCSVLLGLSIDHPRIAVVGDVVRSDVSTIVEIMSLTVGG